MAIMPPKSQPLRPLTDHKNHEILNVIREQSGALYQSRVPVATQGNIREVFDSIWQYPSNRNTFYETLINRIGGSYVNSWQWQNPLAEFKRAALEYGDTYEEIAVGLPKARVYDPNNEYLGADAFGTHKVPIDTLYHTMNREEFYPVTVNESQMRQAFLGRDNGLGSLVSELMGAAARADQLDEFLQMCHMFSEYARIGGYYRQQVEDIGAIDSTEAQAKALLRGLRMWSDKLALQPDTRYNARHMPTVATKDEQVIFTTPEVKSALDVNALAVVFNIEKAEVPSRIVTVPKENFGINGAQAILTTRNFLFVYDNLLETTSQMNAVSLGTNYFLHHWETISVSGFAPAILFWTGTGTDETITLPEGVAASKPVMQTRIGENYEQETPTSVERGKSIQVISTISVSNANVASFKPSGIKYSLGNTSRPVSDYTRVTDTGVVLCGIDEPNNVIPVQAVATYIDPAHPEVPQTISSAYDVPVTGEGVVGFSPSTITAVTVDDVKNAKVGEPVQLQAIAKLVDGRTANVTNMAAWTVTGATVTDNGVMTATKAGTVTAKATVFALESAEKSITIAAAE